MNPRRFALSGATSSKQSSTSFNFGSSTTAPGNVDERLQRLSSNKRLLDRQIGRAVTDLVSNGRWHDAIRCAIEIGGRSQAEIAETLDVMRSTVARWYNRETIPAPDQQANYAVRLLTLFSGRKK